MHKILSMLVITLITPTALLADYTIGIGNIKNVVSRINYHNTMQECIKNIETLLKSNGHSTSGRYTTNPDAGDHLVRIMYTFDNEDGLLCIRIPSDIGDD
ncbi:hypothetical protein OAC90_00190 [Planktomarina sp.]|nr:hypothetical protein [Planktomarina sp.]